MDKTVFLEEIESFKPYLVNRLIVFDLIKPHYEHLTEQNIILLKEFIKTFFLLLKKQKDQEKINELYLSQFIPDSYEIINDQKNLFLMQEQIFQKTVETQIIKERILFKTKIKEYSESLFNELKTDMLEDNTWARYSEFKSYLDRP